MKSLLKIVLLSCLWGPSYLFIKLAVEEIPPLSMQVARVGIGAVILTLIVTLKGTPFPRGRRIWTLLTIQGFIGSAVPFTLFAFGEQFIESSLAAVINGIVPMVAAIASHFCLEDETLTRRKFSGVLIGLVGFLLLLGPTLLDGSVEGDTIGICAVFVACLSYGGAMVFARSYLGALPPLVAPMGQLVTATVYLIPLAILIEQPQHLNLPSPTAIGAVLFLAVMGTAVAFILYYHILATAGATALSSVAYLLPVIGAFLGVFVRDELLTSGQLLAFGVILIGMYLINSQRSSNPQPLCAK
jgi:drug/metabolite transporter (DMT)-like permease